MSRHAFLGTGQYSAKWLGEYDARWEDFRKSVIAMVEMSMFGFAQAGSDLCGFSGEFENDLCENWIKASGMSPFMKMTVDTGLDDDVKMSHLN
jgi:alpha-glucosidase